MVGGLDKELVVYNKCKLIKTDNKASHCGQWYYYVGHPCGQILRLVVCVCGQNAKPGPISLAPELAAFGEELICSLDISNENES